MLDSALPDPDRVPTLKVHEAAKILRISLRTAYLAVERGDIPSTWVQGTIRIPTREFLAKYKLGTP